MILFTPKFVVKFYYYVDIIKAVGFSRVQTLSAQIYRLCMYLLKIVELYIEVISRLINLLQLWWTKLALTTSEIHRWDQKAWYTICGFRVILTHRSLSAILKVSPIIFNDNRIYLLLFLSFYKKIIVYIYLNKIRGLNLE